MSKLKLLLSVLFFTVGAYIGFEIACLSQPASDPWPTALLTGYQVWSLYWGVPAGFRWWRWISPKIWVRSPAGVMMKLGLFLVIPWLGGYLYGFFGGGVYQTLRHVRRASS